MIAINPNETDNHPSDSFQHMVERAKEKQFPFAYVRDETQDAARAYGALRTPHYYAFTKIAGGRWVLRYTGRMSTGKLGRQGSVPKVLVSGLGSRPGRQRDRRHGAADGPA